MPISLFNKPQASAGPAQWAPESQAQPDPWTIKATEGLMGAFGMGDDTKASRLGELVGAAAPFAGAALKGLGVAAPLISIFKDAEGVPSAALREAGTQAFLDRAKHWPQEMSTAAQEFAQRYPRVAAHIRPSYGEVPTMPEALAVSQVPHGQVTSPVEVTLTPTGDEHLYAAKHPTNNARNIMYHEGSHVAQALGNKDMTGLYTNASKLVGYDNNPFEVQATRAGQRSMGNTLTRDTRTAIDRLKDIVALPTYKPDYPNPEDTIKSILEVRENTPLKMVK